ncbi:MAG TPA: metallophosphoesterase [Vicinamibacteria bacterium]|jgi:hypothetical protein|nr:metallophosphoesterase [Vicinamibacteria bacterium]
MKKTLSAVALCSAALSAEARFQGTEAPRTGDPVVLAAGDVASCSDLRGAKATAAILGSLPDATIAVLGDLAYGDGTSQQFRECYDSTWGRFKSRTRPAPGNHDYHTPGAAAYFTYFGKAAGPPGVGYYSYDLGSWHVLSLNSNCTAIGGCSEGSDEERWVKADLLAHKAPCTLAYWHHPLFSSGVNPAHALHPEMRAIWQDLYAAGATLVLNGHEHNYERFALQDPAGLKDPARGIREFVVGTGGKDFDPLGERLPNSEIGSFDTFGVLKLTLHARGYDWEFLPEEGKAFHDQGTGVCH